MKTNEKKIIRIFWLAVILLVLLAIMFAGYIRVIRPNADSKGLLLDNLAIDEQIPLESILGENGYLEISDVDDQIHSVTVPLKCEREDPNSSINVVISADGEKLAEKTVHFRDREEKFSRLELQKPYTPDKDSRLEVRFYDDGSYVPGTASLGRATWNIPQTAFYTDEGSQDYDIGISVEGGKNSYLNVIFCILLAVFLLTYVVLCFGVYQKNWKPEQVFVVLGLVFGIIYTFLWTPYSCPDEYAHFSTAYYYSSELLGEPAVDEEGNVLVRAEDMTLTPQESHTRKYSYSLYETWNESPDQEEQELISLNRGPLSSIPAVAYAPQILAILIARILNLSNIFMLMAGRLFALAAYLVLGYFAIRWIPFAKRAMLVLMLGVSTIQQAASFSYDCLLNACAFLFAACLLRMAYEKEKTTVKDWVLLFVLSIVFSPIKVIYVVMTLAVFLIPNEKIGLKKIQAYVLKAALVVVSFGAVLLQRASSIVHIASTPVDTVNNQVVQGYDLMTILRNPLKVIVLWADTLRVKPVDYFRHMFAGVENANGVSISWTVILGFFILLTVALIVEKNEKVMDLRGKIMGIFISAALFGALLLTFTLDVSCTDLASQFVMGIQGRYFFPFLPLLFPAFQSWNIRAEKSVLPQLAIGIYSMQFLAICTIFETAAGR